MNQQTQQPDREPEYLTPEELAQKVNMSIKFVHKHIGTMRLPGMVRMGRHWRFRRADVEKQLAKGSLLL